VSTDQPLHWNSNGVRIRTDSQCQSDAYLSPTLPLGKLRGDEIKVTLQLLAQNGVKRVFTSAIRLREQDFFRDIGFELHEELLLLGHDLSAQIPTSTHPTRRALRSDWPQILNIDASAFSQFWRFDVRSLTEAIKATPRSRVRVNTGPSTQGFAITGRAGRQGFLQRLAVHPTYQGNGLGHSLVFDALRWLQKRQVYEVLVNTQIENLAALELYESAGFIQRNDGLAVLRWDAKR
jgi:ribosomal protein S18 acetylase RimI-like enzyme